MTHQECSHAKLFLMFFFTPLTRIATKRDAYVVSNRPHPWLIDERTRRIAWIWRVNPIGTKKLKPGSGRTQWHILHRHQLNNRWQRSTGMSPSRNH